MNLEQVQQIIENQTQQKGGLIAMLENIQSKFGYLPEAALKCVAQQTEHSLVDIYGVATFYKSFTLTPRGKHLISVCKGTACHVRGAPSIAREFERQLGIKAGSTTPDQEFTLETVNCLGACALGPIVVIDGHYFSKVHTTQVRQILNQAREGLDKPDLEHDQRIFPVVVRCPRCNHSWMNPHHLVDGFPAIHVTVSFGRQHGWLRLSSLYGSYTSEWEHQVPKEAVVNIFCPHCHAEIVSASNCVECGAPMIPMVVDGGGIVQICSRYGCKSHMLDLNGVNL
ncbi:NAD(P)H-dependent oxidoreductase subunit E [candidate division KSB1 bacterium]|nr:NAD(P)H-dependent oxidoreductase subunit E [candidate division KSB1 bacterium]